MAKVAKFVTHRSRQLLYTLIPKNVADQIARGRRRSSSSSSGGGGGRVSSSSNDVISLTAPLTPGPPPPQNTLTNICSDLKEGEGLLESLRSSQVQEDVLQSPEEVCMFGGIAPPAPQPASSAHQRHSSTFPRDCLRYANDSRSLLSVY